MISIFASGPAAPGLIASVPNNFSEEKIADVSEDNKWRCLEERRQCLENVDPTHLVLASGKIVLQIKLLMNSLQHQQTDRDVEESWARKEAERSWKVNRWNSWKEKIFCYSRQCLLLRRIPLLSLTLSFVLQSVSSSSSIEPISLLWTKPTGKKTREEKREREREGSGKKIGNFLASPSISSTRGRYDATSIMILVTIPDYVVRDPRNDEVKVTI